MRRFSALLLACTMGLLSLCGTAGATEGAQSLGADLPASDSGLSAYLQGEVLVQYDDGTFDVLSYESGADLSDGLEALSSDEGVVLVQPNYTYRSTVLSTDDALSGEQWALSNDGTFQMEEQQNEYPVYEDPFADPAGPGQWTPPQYWGIPGGLPGLFWGWSAASAASDAQVTAKAGIDINAEDAWSVYDGGSRDVVVALIDTGVDTSHEDLAGAFWVNEDEIPGNGIDDDNNGYVDDVNGWNFYDGNNQIYVDSDDDSHGTHGAGTIAAQADNGVGIAGIVQSGHVKIMVLKVLGGADGSGSTASIVQAIQYAEANGASICNLSLGSSVSDRALYQTMADSSMLFVVAAGNDGADSDASPSYPAAYGLDNIISVANLNYDGTLHYSSNYGAASVDLAAPGSYILSTTPEDGYSYMTGTSMAAPMVTAAAAMVYSYYPDITLADVKEILLSSVQPLDTLRGLTATGGMLDLGAAMTYDLSTLSGQGWDNSTAAPPASTPVIQITSASQSGETYLVVQVTDDDGDLDTTAYASGLVSAEQFRSGAGTRFSLDSEGTAAFRVARSGLYTFYAADQAGNETVQTVYVFRNFF